MGRRRSDSPLRLASAPDRPGGLRGTRAAPPPARGTARPSIWATFHGGVDPARSAIMARIRGRDTGPELALRRAVHARGARYRTHVRSLPGRPDLANARAHVAVFVDGCFWHGCPRHFRLPRTRQAFWREKILRNVETRTRVLEAYPDDWHVVQVFECGLRADLDAWATRVARLMRGVEAATTSPAPAGAGAPARRRLRRAPSS